VSGEREVGPATYNQRLAIVSSFYSFSRKRQLLILDNPVSLVDRRKVQAYGSAVALTPQAVTRALQAIDRDTPAGRRDYALLAVALHTGRRVAELVALRRGDILVEGSAVTVTWRRAKGGKVMRDTLPAAVGRALLAWLADWPGEPDASVWVSLAHDASYGKGLSGRSVSNVCAKRLGVSKVHALRHTFARGMEDAGAKVSEIQSRLGHSSLATTGRYLAALHSAENAHGEHLAALFGVE
jgi:integrase